VPTPLAHSDLAALSDEEIKEAIGFHGVRSAAHQGCLAVLAAEMERRHSWDGDGASSMAAWMVERTGVSERTGRALTCIGERLFDLPHLARAFQAGQLSLDKVAVVVVLATPESDAEVTEVAQGCSVKELQLLARHRRGVERGDQEARHDGRYLRFDDSRGTLAGRLPQEDYALVKNAIDAVVTTVGSDGETPLDQRRADALTRLCGSGGSVGRTKSAGTCAAGASQHLVVVHVDVAQFTSLESTAVAEVERFGPIGAEVARRLACGADLAVAFDDELGHTMFEGRAERFATEAQRRELWRRDGDCRFPDCGHTNFTIAHHVIHWEHQGLTDLSNLVLLCQYHHHQVHRRGWRILGDANGELTFIGPAGRAMTSRPSPRWTKAKDKPD
jgi:hypothetical protein